MHLLASYLFIFCLALGAACGSDNAGKKQDDSVESALQEENLQQRIELPSPQKLSNPQSNN